MGGFRPAFRAESSMPNFSRTAPALDRRATTSALPPARSLAQRPAGLPGQSWVAAALASAILTACGSPPFPSGTVQQLFPTGPRPEFTRVQVQGQTIASARMNGLTAPDAAQPMLLFVHGSPGSWKAWSGYLKAAELAGYPSRVAVDRPGFGASSTPGVMPDLRQQAALLTALIPPGQKAIVIGHSLGAPLAAWMAIDAPERVCGVVSIAGSLSSAHEAPRWFNQLADSTLASWAVPTEMLRSNQEMMPLQAELVKLELALPLLKTPFILMQGGKDALVDPRTADEVEKRAPRQWLRVQRLPQEGHFVLWEKPQLVNDAILSLACS
jgi:pimeloyl-ACP methyl ester carboxylesterase